MFFSIPYKLCQHTQIKNNTYKILLQQDKQILGNKIWIQIRKSGFEGPKIVSKTLQMCQVVEFLNCIPNLEYAALEELVRENEIDGESLLLLTQVPMLRFDIEP